MISWGELHCALAKKKGGGASFQSFMKIVFKAKQEMTAKGGESLRGKKERTLASSGSFAYFMLFTR